MSTLQVGQGFMTLRSRMVRPVATGLSGPVPLTCIVLKQSAFEWLKLALARCLCGGI